MSLYIPRVFTNISNNRIKNVFESLDIGIINRVDIVNNQGYNSVYVHFAEWFDTPTVQRFQERVLSKDKPARIVYDDPWYWIVLENKTKKHPSNHERKIIVNVDNSPPSVEDPNTELVSADYAQLIEQLIHRQQQQIQQLINERENNKAMVNLISQMEV